MEEENNYIWFRSSSIADDDGEESNSKEISSIHDMLILFGKPIALYKDDSKGRQDEM